MLLFLLKVTVKCLCRYGDMAEIGGKMWVMGGIKIGPAPTDEIASIDVDANKVVVHDGFTLPAKILNHRIVAISHFEAVVFGGFEIGGFFRKQTYIFDTRTLGFVRKSDRNYAIRYPATGRIRLTDGKDVVISVGGTEEITNQSCDIVEICDIAADTWTERMDWKAPGKFNSPLHHVHNNR